MSTWVVLDTSGFTGTTNSVIGPFDSMEAAWDWCDREGRDMSETDVRSTREPDVEDDE